VQHESTLERDFVTLTSFLDPNASIISQPVTLRFRENSRARRYTPDFLVRRSDGLSELVEVKYQTDLSASWSRLQPAFAAAKAWAAVHAATFHTVTEQEIRGPVLENAKRLLPLRSAPLDSQAAERTVAVVRQLPAATFSSILAAMSCDPAVALATLWRLIARGTLRVDLAAPITLDTPISLT
jgi:TnsA-like endonuclease N terminal